MPEKLKQKILEIATLAKECPDNLQEKCFELLLAEYLQQHRSKSPGEEAGGKQTEKDDDKGKGQDDGKNSAKQEDILEGDLHVKARQFLKKSGLTIEHINQLFYKEEGNFLPLYDDLKTTKGSESQIRIALLHSLVQGMHNGDFEFNVESVREEAKNRKCLDKSIFASHFKNNKDIFEAYDISNPVIKLNAEGKSKLAVLIKELQ
jgi:hypothetical protein